MLYKEGTIVMSKYGYARIERIWSLNSMITVYETVLIERVLGSIFEKKSKKTLFYGEIAPIESNNYIVAESVQINESGKMI